MFTPLSLAVIIQEQNILCSVIQQFRNTCLTHTGYPTVKVTRQNKYNLKYGMHLCLCVHKIYFLERKNPGKMNNNLLVDKNI